MQSVVETYCRDIEAYLCRKNDGHLIRITGPAFEQVSRWAEQGIPLKVACEGIDRYFERYYRTGRRRRPVRVEFCEADVLDAFDAWRRAVGVTADEGQGQARARASLATHVERSIARLTALRAGAHAVAALDAELDRVARELDLLQPRARNARGQAREDILSTLAALDATLVGVAMHTMDSEARAHAEAEARAELAPFRDRMSPADYERACLAAVERHIRQRLGLPMLTFA